MEHKDGALVDPTVTANFALDRYCSSDDDRSILTDALTTIINGHDLTGPELYALLLTAVDLINQRAAKQAGS